MAALVEKQTTVEEKIDLVTKYDKLLEGLPALSLHVKKNLLINDINKNVKTLINADHVHIRTIDWLEEKLVLECHSSKKKGIFEHLLFKKIDANNGLGGSVFTQARKDHDFRPFNTENAQNVPSFKEYKESLTTSKEKCTAELVDYLDKVGPALVVVLRYKSKPIGVITALRKADKNPSRFDKEDEKILEHFANQASVALRNAWLFEAAMWQPPTNPQNLTVEQLCNEVVNEAKRTTGAKNGRVRFFNWEEGEDRKLVPGALVTYYRYGEKHQRDPRVYIRKKGLFNIGQVEKTQEPLLITDLNENEKFTGYKKYVRSKTKMYVDQLNIFYEMKSIVEDYSGSFYGSRIVDLQKDSRFRGNPELSERWEQIMAQTDDESKKAMLNRHIVIVDTQATEWGDYYSREVVNLKSEVIVPILIGKEIVGVMNIHSDEENWFTDSDRAILQALAGRITAAILLHQYNAVRAISEIERDMISKRSFDLLDAKLKRKIQNLAFFSGCEDMTEDDSIFTFEPHLQICVKPKSPQELINNSDNFNTEFSPQKDDASMVKNSENIIRNDGLGYKAVKQLANSVGEKIFIVCENVDDPLNGGSKLALSNKILTTACLPLAFENKVYGLLYIDIKKQRYFFTSLEKDILTLFANHAAIVLKNLLSMVGDSEEYTYDQLCGNKLIEDSCDRPASLTRGK